MTIATALAILAALGATSLLAGRLVAGAFRLRWLDPFEPTRAAASAVVGTMGLTVLYGRLSDRGLAAPRILALCALALMGLFVATLVQRRLHVLRPVGRPAHWFWLGVALALAAAASLLPLLLAGGYDAGNDTYTYCAFSEWLQGHGFGEPATADPASPVTALSVNQQGRGFPLGAAFVLALARAARGDSSLVLYPLVSAWGVMLVACALWVAARWCLGLSWRLAAAGVIAFALLPHTVYWAHHHGFLSQTYAEAALVLALAVLARRWTRPAGGFSGVVLLALAAAYLVTVYLPFVPVLAAATLVSLAALEARRGGWTASALLSRVGTFSALFLLFAGFSLWSRFKGLLMLVGVTVGGLVPLRWGDWLSVGLGTAACASHGRLVGSLPGLVTPATAAALGLLALGVASTAASRRASGLTAALAVFAALVGYYALFVLDPWTGQRGHTWSVFKSVQWAYPLVFLLQLRGLCAVRRLGRLPLLGAAALVVALATAHAPWSRALGREMRTVIVSEHPYQEATRVRERLAGLPPGELLLLGRPAGRSVWLAAVSALLAHPRPIVADWQDSASLHASQSSSAAEAALEGFLRRPEDSGIIPLLAGFEPFDASGLEPLGGGFFRVRDTSRPLLVQVLAPRGQDDRPVLTDEGRTKLVFLSLHACAAEVRVSTAGAVPALRYQVIAGLVGGPAFRAAVRQTPPARTVAGPAPFRLRVDLARGLTTLALTADSPVPIVEVQVSAAR